MLTGKFTINSSGNLVQFSQGNLQFLASTKTWRFAEHQYDYVGNAIGNTTATGRDTQADRIDLFGWGTNMVPAGWRTLKSDEWTYLFNGRTSVATRYCKATVNGVSGVVLFPDSYMHPVA